MVFAPDFSQIEKQTIAYNTIRSPDIDEILYGGAKGGGKSVFGIYWSYLEAYEIAQKYFPEKPEFPVPVGFMGRKVGKHFKDTTLETWKRFIPADRYRIIGKPAEIIIEERVKILTGGLDRSEEMEKFNSAELAFFFIDQAEETTEDDISVLRACLRLVLNGKELNYKGVFTANPRLCWLRNEFIINPTSRRKFIQALPGDNPLLPETYVKRLKDSFKHRPELLEAYLYGSWDVFEGLNLIIKQAWLDAAKSLKFFPPKIRKLVVCDPARFGDDETVIYYMENTEIVEQKIYGQGPLTKCAGECAEMSNKHKDGDQKPTIVVDGDGLGGGVVDMLVSWGFNVYEIHSSGKAIEPDRFYNVRAEMWWTAGVKYSNNDISDGDFSDEELDRQLTMVSYDFRNGKILVQPKFEIKKNLARSPDRADARIMGLYALQFIEPVSEEPLDEYQRTEASESYKAESSFA